MTCLKTLASGWLPGRRCFRADRRRIVRRASARFYRASRFRADFDGFGIHA